MGNVKKKVNAAPWPGDGATLAIIKFGVAPGYDIEEHKGEKIIAAEEDSEYRYYSPLEVDCIYSHLAAVKTEEDLCEFACRFGLLGVSERKDFPLSLAGQIPSYWSHIWDSVDESLKVAEEVRQLLELVNGCKVGKVIHRKDVFGFIEELWPEYLPVLKNADSIRLTRAYVALRVSSKLGGVRLAASFTEKGDVAPGVAYFSLFDAVWHQFYVDLVGHAKFKQCPYCGAWHTGRGKFCPPPPYYSRSPCQNSYAVRKHNQKKSK